MLNRRDDLATEAAKLLRDRQQPVAVARRALAAAHEPLRRQAVAWLAADYERDPAARDALRHALQSRYPEVREGAAVEHTVGDHAEIGADAVVGPFAVLSPGSHVAAGVRTGAFYTGEIGDDDEL